jgi:hypothetical protein
MNKKKQTSIHVFEDNKNTLFDKFINYVLPEQLKPIVQNFKKSIFRGAIENNAENSIL